MSIPKSVITIEVLDSDAAVTKGQQAILDAFKEQSSFSVDELVNRFGFRSRLPLISRINHLIERGRLQVV